MTAEINGISWGEISPYLPGVLLSPVISGSNWPLGPPSRNLGPDFHFLFFSSRVHFDGRRKKREFTRPD